MSEVSSPSVADVAAPLLLGTLWNWTLFGVLVVQTYVYGYNFWTEDKTPLKLLVYAIFSLETLQTVLSGYDLYRWFVSGFGDEGNLLLNYASAFDLPIMGSMVSYIVQLFFVYRIWVISEKSSKFLCLIICLLSTINTTAAVGTGVFSQSAGTFLMRPDVFMMIWLGGNTLSDLLITGSLLYHLRRQRFAGDGFSHINHALTKIVRLAIETNLITTTVGIVSLSMIVLAYIGDFKIWAWYICPTAILGKLYSNALLASLNNRISIREARERQATVGSPGIAFVVTPRHRVPSDTMRVELEEHSPALEERRSRDSTGQDSGSNESFDIACFEPSTNNTKSLNATNHDVDVRTPSLTKL